MLSLPPFLFLRISDCLCLYVCALVLLLVLMSCFVFVFVFVNVCSSFAYFVFLLFACSQLKLMASGVVRELQDSLCEVCDSTCDYKSCHRLGVGFLYCRSSQNVGWENPPKQLRGSQRRKNAQTHIHMRSCATKHTHRDISALWLYWTNRKLHGG